jgi:hypothetical protein
MIFELSCTCIKRRKCVRMILPINSSTPHIGYRGSKRSYGLKTAGITEPGIAMINAGGLAVAAGGATTAVSRIYTKSWPQALMLGVCGTFLTLFFMAPRFIESFGIKKNVVAVGAESTAVKKEAVKVAEIAKQFKPAKKLVPFRQQS